MFGLIRGDAREIPLESNSVHTVITSPPFWGHRKYPDENQIGQESTFIQYLDHVAAAAEEIRRVLRPDGTFWLNLGDSYSQENQGAIKKKDQCLIPFRAAIRLQESGWYVRSEVIWDKPNAMPEPTRDRVGKSHEYLFIFSKTPSYYFDAAAIRVPFADERQGRDGGTAPSQRNRGGRDDGFTKPSGIDPSENGGRNPRSVWRIPVGHDKTGRHKAAYPPRLIVPCVLASTPAAGCCARCKSPFACECGAGKIPCTVFDPFNGRGTTGLAALILGRSYVGMDLSMEYLRYTPEYIENEGSRAWELTEAITET